MAAIYNFDIEKGSSFYIAFQYTDENNNIINLTNYCARLSLQTNSDPSSKITYLTDTINSTYSFVISPSDGKIILQLPVATTESFNFTGATYDLDIKAPNELFPGSGPNITRILNGNIGIISRNIVSPDPFVCNSLNDPDNCLNCE